MVLSDGSQTLIGELAGNAVKATLLSGARVSGNLGGAGGLRVDSAGRVWLPRSDESATLIDDGGARVVPDTGIPRLEDSAGRIWFVNLAKREVVVMEVGGALSSVNEDALSEGSDGC